MRNSKVRLEAQHFIKNLNGKTKFNLSIELKKKG